MRQYEVEPGILQMEITRSPRYRWEGSESSMVPTGPALLKVCGLVKENSSSGDGEYCQEACPSCGHPNAECGCAGDAGKDL